MSDAEKIMNQDLLNKLRTDPTLLSKIQEKMPSPGGQPFKRLSNNIFNS